MKNHTVQWLTELKTPECLTLTQYYIEIDTPTGNYVGAQWAPLGKTAVHFDLPDGDYVEKVAAATADGLVKEGWIERPFTVGGAAPVDPPVDPPVVEPFPFPKWGEPWVPPVIEPGQPDKTIWDESMLEWGIVHGDYLFTEPPPIVDHKIGHIYYDMGRVMYQIADYTETPEPWTGYAKQAIRWYRDDYVLPNNGGVPGYQNFTTGLRLDFERTGDVASKNAAILLSQNAAYAPDTTPPEWVANHALSREVAYALLSYINAEKLGEAKRDIRARYVDLSYDYIRQWQDRSAWGDGQISPFMQAITAQALIADWEETQDARCLPALRALADWMWPLCWDESTSALLYQINPDSSEGVSVTGAPDLNMLIAPWFGWLWVQTGDVQYRDKFDALLYGHRNAFLAEGKQFDQGYWWAFDGMRWREGP